MSEADKLLDSLDEGENNVVEEYEEPHIVINEDRSITVPPELKEIAVQFDHDVETVTFDCPRWWDGHDMFNMNVHINYMTPDGKVHYYIARDKVLDKEDENIMHFAWTFSRNVTEVKGSIKFLVCIKNVNAEGEEVNHWNSKLSTDLYILEGLESDTAEIIDKYPDIIEGLLKRMDDLEKIGLSTKIDIEELSHNGRRANKVIITSSSGVKEFIVTDGVDFIPHVSAEGELSWTNDAGMENPEPVNVRGATFTPSIDEQGNISWTNDKELENPETVNVTGPKGATGAFYNRIELIDGSASVDPLQKYRIHSNMFFVTSEILPVTLGYTTIGGAYGVVGDKIYIFGGSWAYGTKPTGVYSDYINAIQVFDTKKNEVKTLSTKFEKGLCYAVGSTVDKKIYIFGGIADDEDLFSYRDKIHVFNTETEQLTRLDLTIPDGREWFSAVTVGTKIYLIGGSYVLNDLSMDMDTIAVFDTGTNTFETLSIKLPVPLENTSATVIGTKIYISGGYFYDQDVCFYNREIFILDTSTNTITKSDISNTHDFELYHTVSIGSKLYSIENADLNNKTHRIVVLNTETDTIKLLPEILNRAVTDGGSGDFGFVCVNDKAYRLEPRLDSTSAQGEPIFSNKESDKILSYSFDVVGCDIEFVYGGGSYNFKDDLPFDEYCNYIDFEILTVKLNEVANELTLVYTINNKRYVKIISGNDLDISNCQLIISNANELLQCNTISGIASALKIVSTNLIGQDENGGNIYEQVFDNGMTQQFTAPKGKDSEVEVVRLL